jgi:hypothetical protein
MLPQQRKLIRNNKQRDMDHEFCNTDEEGRDNEGDLTAILSEIELEDEEDDNDPDDD